MTAPALPTGLVEARHTPVFDAESVPGPLAAVHHTTVWAMLHVQEGTVRYTDLGGEQRRDERLEAGDALVIVPGVPHHVDPSTDARFFIQFYREPDADPVPGQSPEPLSVKLREGPWQHRGRDLDSAEEIFELVTRQYADVVQDDLLAGYFTFGEGFMDWQALIGTVADYWNHVLLYAPGYEIDTIDHHRAINDEHPFAPELFDRWLQIFHDTVDGGWSGPTADIAKKRGTGMARAMANRLLGRGVWRPAGTAG